MMKPRQKISGAFRGFDALVDIRRIRGYVSTARKNGLNALDALRRVFLGNPFVPAVNTSEPSDNRQRQTPWCPRTRFASGHAGRSSRCSGFSCCRPPDLRPVPTASDSIAGWLGQQQCDVTDYIQEESRVWRGSHGERLSAEKVA